MTAGYKAVFGFSVSGYIEITVTLISCLPYLPLYSHIGSNIHTKCLFDHAHILRYMTVYNLSRNTPAPFLRKESSSACYMHFIQDNFNSRT
jgi:hypothetical protein